MRFTAVFGALCLGTLFLGLDAAVLIRSASAANAPAPTVAPAQTGMLAHKALYTLTLDTANGNDVVAARGTMGYEVTDACDGWAVRQRLRMTLTNSEGQDIEMASDYATWESKDGLKFRYHMRQTTDTAVTSQTDGEASLPKAGGAGEAHGFVEGVDGVNGGGVADADDSWPKASAVAATTAKLRKARNAARNLKCRGLPHQKSNDA